MAIGDDLKSEVNSILTQPWDIQDGIVVPNPEDIVLGGGAKKLNVTMLYADLAESTALVSYNTGVASKVFKCFLFCCTKLIRHNGGHVRSFDGDRVMGVFIGNYKNSAAAICAFQIKWAFNEIVKSSLEARYSKISDGTYNLGYCCGIDTGEILVVRSGIRGSNDLLWVGRPANIAAKLSSIRNPPYMTYATEAAYKMFDDQKVKITSGGQSLWERVENVENWGGAGVLYRSEGYWPLG